METIMSPLGSTIASHVASEIESGPYGTLGLALVAACVLIPITQYKTLYAISVGYGLSVACIGWVLGMVFSPDWSSVAGAAVAAACFYGLRLASYLLQRDLRGWKPAAEYERPPMARFQRVVMAVLLALLYATMTTPLLYMCRHASLVEKSPMSRLGVASAWLAAILEAVADGHKHWVKTTRVDPRNKDLFVGPRGGLYRMTRHPNYSAEVLFWTSLFMGGFVALPAVPLLLSALGTASIVHIMIGSTRRLEKRHNETYGRQPAYRLWAQNVPYPLFPFVRSQVAAK